MPAQDSSAGLKTRSSYIEYLPALYRDDEFMEQFLLIFESIMKPLENQVDSLALYLDPLVTAEPLLPWLAFWVDLSLDPSWPLERRRELVKSAATLYRWRGTRRGLSEYLRIYTGSVPEISEYIPGMRLDPETRLGINTKLGSSGASHHFTVTLQLDGDSQVNTSVLRQIIEAQKPAHTVYTLEVRQNGQRQEGEDDA